jgi:predicted DNA-binding transcriptional regulator AlpA
MASMDPHTTLDNRLVDELRILSAREVSALIGRSLVTLERWRRQKKGPLFIRMSGTRVGYPAHELKAWQAKALSTIAKETQKLGQ